MNIILILPNDDYKSQVVQILVLKYTVRLGVWILAGLVVKKLEIALILINREGLSMRHFNFNDNLRSVPGVLHA